MIDKQQLKTVCERCGMLLSPGAEDLFDRYAEMLVRANQKTNLTAITDPNDILYKHFVDSLMPLRVMPISQGAKLLDVGSGAGFPGMPLKIARPDLNVTLLEARKKRADFLSDLSYELELETEVIAGRAEERAHDEAYRECFDIVCARAVASLSLMCEYCIPFLKPQGIFVAYKGPSADEEIAEAGEAISLLGGELKSKRSLTLPGGDMRTLVLIRKTSPTPPKYPRTAAQMAKRPL